MISKINQINKCKNCELYKNQKPLLDKKISCDVMWLGLSAKKVKDININYSLENNTNSGKLIEEIEKRRPNLKFYKSNLVKCLPLDENSKLRYPQKCEMNSCLENLLIEINYLKPKVIFLLGNIVNDFVTKNINQNNLKLETKLIKLEHPSYISTYRKKHIESYIEKILAYIDNNI